MYRVLAILKKNKWVIAAVLIAAAVLVVAFVSGGSLRPDNAAPSPQSAVSTRDSAAGTTASSCVNEPTESGSTIAASQPVTQKTTEAQRETRPTAATVSAGAPQTGAAAAAEASQAQTTTTGAARDRYQTDETPSGIPEPVEPQQQIVGTVRRQCTVSVSCAAALAHMDELSAEIAGVIPPDGVILPPTTVTFNEGESVFDVLKQVCKSNAVHMEYTDTPVYNSAYIEGIGNLYEFDCGSVSGWMYRVNGRFPNYGCSRYAVKDGDVIEWLYTCNLGRDIGGDYGGQTGRE